MKESGIDKSKWGDGPWQAEPDRAEWRHAGFPCLLIRQGMGNWCGYVGLPSEHPLYGKHYDEPDVSVHGGLTFSDYCRGHICYTAQPGEAEHVWWLGFDCNHGGDFAPGMAADMKRFMPRSRYGRDEIYRDQDYATQETNRLAEQLKAKG